MKKQRNQRPVRKMKPVFLVFCEGETEEAYVNFLRQKYRLPIKVIPHITGLAISPKLLKRHIQYEQIGPSDTITSFLMYDFDTPEIEGKIMKCLDVKNLHCVDTTSNPCIELWFLLHSAEQHSAISTKDCIIALRKSAPEWETYEKGCLSENQKQSLWVKRLQACENAKALPECQNPSTAVFRLINAMEDVT